MGPYSTATLLGSIRQQHHHVGHRRKKRPDSAPSGPPVCDHLGQELEAGGEGSGTLSCLVGQQLDGAEFTLTASVNPE